MGEEVVLPLLVIYRIAVQIGLSLKDVAMKAFDVLPGGLYAGSCNLSSNSSVCRREDELVGGGKDHLASCTVSASLKRKGKVQAGPVTLTVGCF